jgi:hypothetical protein
MGTGASIVRVRWVGGKGRLIILDRSFSWRLTRPERKKKKHGLGVHALVQTRVEGRVAGRGGRGAHPWASRHAAPRCAGTGGA